MIRIKVHFPILFLVLLTGMISCKKQPGLPTPDYYVLKDRGDTLYKYVKFDSAYSYYNKAKESCPDKAGEHYGYVLLCMATIQQYTGDYFGAEETITEALANYQGQKYTPHFYNILAIIYDKQKDYKTALRYYEKAYMGFTDDTAKAIAKNNIGLNYLERKQYSKAIQILKPQLKDPYLQSKKKEIARVMDNIGYAQFKLNDPEAFSSLSGAMRLRDSLSDYNGLIASNIHLSEYYNKKGDKESSQKFAANTLLSAKKVNSPDDELNALKWINENNGTELAKRYIKLSDSIILARTIAKNQFAKIRYDSTEAIKDAGIQKGQKKLYFILLLSAVVISILLYIFIRIRNQKKLKVISYQTETRIAKKIHDELANDVYQTMAYAETQNLQDTDKREVLLQSLDNIYARARNISQENSEIPTGRNYSDALMDLLNSFNSAKVSVIINNSQSLDWTAIKKESKIALYRVLQELMVNMKKHSQGSLVIIGFNSMDKTIEIKYSDNGQGTDDAAVVKKGLQNVENRILDIKGSITFETETDKGFRVTITIPK